LPLQMPEGESSTISRFGHEADAAKERGKQLLKESLSTPDPLAYERISRDALSRPVEAARLRDHADELEKDEPWDKD
jgi:hypothetical protein